MNANPEIYLNQKKARNFTGHHPWILSHSVIQPTIELQAGTIVELVTPQGKWIARGIYNPASRIRVRLYQWQQDEQLDAAWVQKQLSSAVSLRRIQADLSDERLAVRLVNSEGDGLSGLIVDKFGSHVVVQFTSLAMFKWKDAIVDCLNEQLAPSEISLRIDEKTASNEGLEQLDTTSSGSPLPDEIEVEENGIKLAIELQSGQKTGYYLDQRKNRLAAAKWIRDGAMLDVCSYHGGFTLAALRHGSPDSVRAVDSSAVALERLQKNAQLNGFENIDTVKADCFDYLEQLAKSEERFQTIVLDPPRMAGNRNQVPAALRAYHRLNLSAVNSILPGGILVTCSCSGRVSRADFSGMLGSVSKRTRRPIQIVEMLGADFDHPVSVNCPETEYLKCFICRVG
ncbi:MAG: class I SAM-dependent methyltransferase [Aureliella sp.]